MTLRKSGKDYPTVADAAAHFGVSTKTIDNWIEAGVIPPPPTLMRGLAEIRIYPDSYLNRAERALKRHREKQQKKRSSQGDGRKRR